MAEQTPGYRPRLTLATLFWIVTAVAAAMAWERTHRQLVQTRTTVTSMRALARELRIEDPERIAVVTRLPTLPNELIFDVYLPPQRGNEPPQRGNEPPQRGNEPPYQLCWALEGITGHDQIRGAFPKPQQRVPLPPGRHSIEMRHIEPGGTPPNAEHRIQVLVDDQVVMRATRPSAWKPSDGWTSGGTITQCRAFEPDQPLELRRLRFNEPTSSGSVSAAPEEAVNGMLLWIEPANSRAAWSR